MQLAPNFNLKEFVCKDGSGVPLELLANVKELAENLQVLRDFVNTPIIINSGYRTPAYNKKIGGAKYSQHMQAKAADIRIKGFTPKEIKSTIELLIKDGKMKDGGIGLYKTFVHYDIGNKRRWNG